MDMQEIGFITKVLAPRGRAGLIERPRLIEQLAADHDVPVTALIAPGGYGKTTLAQQFAAEAGLPWSWLTLDGYDCEPARLLRYLIASLDRVVAGLADLLLPALDQQDEQPGSIQGGLARLVTLVHLRAPGPFLLVLDDVHLVEASAAAQQVLEPFLQHLPHACRILLLGRRLPDLPILQRLQARRELTFVDASDLAFRGDEARELVGGLSAGKLSAEETACLIEQAEGWAAALALGVQAGDSTRRGAISGESLFAILCAEVYESLPPEQQQLWLAAAVPDRVTPSLLATLLGEESAPAPQLARLLDTDPFLQRIDGAESSYRLHQLYREFLQRRLREIDPLRFNALHLRAAALLAESGAWREAVYHCGEAEAWDQAATILEQTAAQAARGAQWRGLAETIALLPDRFVDQRPALAFHYAQARYRCGEVAHALDQLDQILPTIERAGPSILLARALVLRGAILRTSGRLRQASEYLTRGITMLMEYDAPIGYVAEARRQLGLCAGMQGDFERAEQELLTCLDVFASSHDRAGEASVHHDLGICLKRMGQAEAALLHYQRASTLWRELGSLGDLAGDLNSQGTLHLEHGEQAAAGPCFAEALASARSSANARQEAYALLGLGDVGLASGCIDEASQRFKAALDRGLLLGEPYPLTYAHCGLAETCRQNGEARRAEALLLTALAQIGRDGNRQERALCLYHLGLVQRDQRDAAAAICSLSEAAAMFAAHNARREEARASFVLATIQFEQRQRRTALTLLERVAELVDELRSEQCVLDLARQAPMLLQYAAAHRTGDGLFARLVRRLLEQPAAAGEAVPSGEAPFPRVTVRTLGSFDIDVGERRVSDLEWRSSASKELFLFLLHTRAEQRKEDVMSAIWPDLDLERGSRQFHSSLYRARQAVFPESVVHAHGRYSINSAATIDYDVADFQRLLAEAEAFPQGSEQRAACLRDALQLYRGPFAEELYSEWSNTIRMEMEDRFLRATASLAGYHAGRGQYEASIELCRRTLAVDAYHEGATLELMRSWAAKGDVSMALRVYRRYAELVREDGDTPAPALTRLFNRLSAEVGEPVARSV